MSRFGSWPADHYCHKLSGTKEGIFEPIFDFDKELDVLIPGWRAHANRFTFFRSDWACRRPEIPCVYYMDKKIVLADHPFRVVPEGLEYYVQSITEEFS